MISITSAQLNLWLATFIWPFARVLGLIASVPLLGNISVPARIRIGLSVLITAAIMPTLAPMPNIDVGSLGGLVVLAQQILAGIAMGFAMQIVFAAVDAAGEIIGLEMGIGVATLFDPQTQGQTPVIGSFLGVFATLLFLSVNGHLLVISVLVESFQTLPITGAPTAFPDWMEITNWGNKIFLAGLMLSMPLLAALLITNLAMGILTRAAPQLNMFAVGFPITLLLGLMVLSFSFPYFVPAMERLFQEGLQAMVLVAK